MKIISLWILACFAIGLGGCSVLPEPREIALYQLPDTSLSSSAAATDHTLRIKTPRTSDALNGSHIHVMEHDNQLSAYGGARWVSPVPTLWQDHMVRAFLADGRLNAVTTDRENLQAEHELSGSLRAFHVDLRGSTPEAVIRFDAIFAKTASRQIIASRSFIVRQPLQGHSVAEIVTALGSASDRVCEELLNWMTTQHSKTLSTK